MQTRIFAAVSFVLTSLYVTNAYPAPITVGGLVTAFRDNEGPNTVNSGVGDNVSVVARLVDPNLTTVGIATNPQYGGVLPLLNLFTARTGFFARTFANDALNVGGTVTQPWTLTFQNRSDVKTVQTNSLAGVGQLPLLSNLTVSGPALSPTLTWDTVVTAVPYDQVRLSVYNDRTDQIIVIEQFIGNAGLTSYTVPLGTLAPNENYAFRVYLWDSSGPGGTVLNRSSTHVNHSTTDPAVGAGALFVAGGGTVSSLSLTTGANNYPNASILIGGNGRGAATLQAGTTLSSGFLNIATNQNLGATRYGTLIVDNTTVTMNGGTVDDGITQFSGAGFVTVGRQGGARGFLDVINGAQVVINHGGFLTPGMNIGREAGSFGTVNVDGSPSRIVIQGPTTPDPSASNNGLINVGRSGDGRLNITNGGVVANDADGETNIGRDPGSRGSVLVSGTGSQFNAGKFLNIGPNGGGEGLLRIRDGGVVVADQVTLGQGGILTGDLGSLIGDLTIAGGVVSPGDSPGTLTINGDVIFSSGVLLLEALGPGQIDRIVVNGSIVIGAAAEIDVLLGYEPNDVLSFLEASNGIFFEDGFAGPSVYGLIGTMAPVGSMVQVKLGDRIFEVRVQGVPEPGTLALLFLSLAAFPVLNRFGVRPSRASEAA